MALRQKANSRATSTGRPTKPSPEGMKDGMLSLTHKNFRVCDNALNDISKGVGYSLIIKEIKKASQTEVLLTPADEDKNIIKMFKILLT